jgi:transcriptional regulator with XRE-family HTH domain
VPDLENEEGAMTKKRIRLTVEREARGWSRAALARRARIDQGTYSKIEQGRVIPYPIELGRIARALRVPAENAAALLDEVPETAAGVES